MPAPKNYVGKRFGMLVVLKRKRENNITYYYCKCDCGEKKWMQGSVLIHATSCGCLRNEKLRHNVNLTKAHLDKNIVDGSNLAVIKRETPKSNNKSGVTGVHWDKTREKWLSQINLKGKHYFLGRFKNKEDAIEARKKAEKRLFKPFLESLEEK